MSSKQPSPVPSPRASDILADDSIFYDLAASLAKISDAIGPNGAQVLSNISDSVDLRYSRGKDELQEPRLEHELGTIRRTAQETFCYRPLEDEEMAFRILVVHPGDPSQPLTGTIEHDIVRKEGAVPHSYYRERSYDAISYVWNSDLKPCSIFLDGHKAMITQSLFNALVRFRIPHKDRRLWADAICINQDDKKERAAQVALMPLIYTFASKVLVYLGEQSDRSELVPQLIETVIKLDATQLREVRLDRKGAAVFVLPPEDDHSWEAIVKFFCRPWFSRIWIIQEVILTRNACFYCGDWELRWWQIAAMGERFDRCLKGNSLATWDSEDFIRAQQGAASVALMHGFQQTRSTVAARLSDFQTDITSLSPSSRVRNDLAPDIAAKRDSVILSYKQHPDLFPLFERTVLALDCIKSPTTPILKLLGVFSQHEASIPRDRLFALVGLAGDMDLKDFPPDYDESESETNARFSRTLVEKGQGMDVLYHATKHPVEWEYGSYPSWSPWWTMRQSIPLRHWLQLGWAYSSHSGGFDGRPISTDFVSLVEDQPHLLKVRGSHLGSLQGSTCIAKIKIDDFKISVFPARAKQYFEDVSQLMNGAPYFTGESWVEVQCRTLIADHGVKKRLSISTTTKEFLETKDRFTRVPLQKARPDLLGNEWASQWFGLAGYYAACKTSEGYVGLVPSQTSEDDEITMIQGSDLPFVLRPIPGFRSYYQFIGGCYMHGLMRGEAWKQVEGQKEILLI